MAETPTGQAHGGRGVAEAERRARFMSLRMCHMCEDLRPPETLVRGCCVPGCLAELEQWEADEATRTPTTPPDPTP